MSNTNQCEECESTGRNCLAHSLPGSPGRSFLDPHALENLPPLDGWTNEALVRDFMRNVARTENADVIDMNADTNALREEILRRMECCCAGVHQ